MQLLNRLDQLNEIANQREHADLLSDLNNINLFCFPVTSQKHKFTAAAAEFSGSADTSVSEQSRWRLLFLLQPLKISELILNDSDS